ncbi:RNA polymerase sigma factor [Reyranella sp. CPCC 100927]|uniref:RNA polymerase sigma factor n=1 Tax=Reyranella sp. CPCC 100927 TaxID=2599616 RepID=UPI0011B66604|nr:sigma-70 family RNA polymerase sigma factor [Reyranella sp. CPCC 100927]TWT05630.1 sigma-70 family RNA polymerase sigma factor [Reyranella sp. CPCC 100927]
MASFDDIDLPALLAGGKRDWDRFVAAAAPVIHAVARRVVAAHGVSADEAVDVAQDVFVRLCADDRRLLRAYDPARSSMSTWLAVVARSCAVDHLRRRRQAHTPLDDVPESATAIEDRHVERLNIPAGLLTERQALILHLLYDREMDVAEVAAFLKVDAQTVRSTHHKAMLRLREHFRIEA